MVDPRTFLGAVLAGRESITAIEDWIDAWHRGPSPTKLHTFLGFSEEEYANWTVCSDTLPHIVAIHRLVEVKRDTILATVAKESGLQ